MATVNVQVADAEKKRLERAAHKLNISLAELFRKGARIIAQDGDAIVEDVKVKGKGSK